MISIFETKVIDCHKANETLTRNDELLISFVIHGSLHTIMKYEGLHNDTSGELAIMNLLFTFIDRLRPLLSTYNKER